MEVCPYLDCGYTTNSRRAWNMQRHISSVHSSSAEQGGGRPAACSPVRPPPSHFLSPPRSPVSDLDDVSEGPDEDSSLAGDERLEDEGDWQSDYDPNMDEGINEGDHEGDHGGDDEDDDEGDSDDDDPSAYYTKAQLESPWFPAKNAEIAKFLVWIFSPGTPISYRKLDALILLLTDNFDVKNLRGMTAKRFHSLKRGFPVIATETVTTTKTVTKKVKYLLFIVRSLAFLSIASKLTSVLCWCCRCGTKGASWSSTAYQQQSRSFRGVCI